MLTNFIKRFCSDDSGNFAFTFGLTLLPVFCIAGLALDYSEIQRERSRLQETADSAALYAAKAWEKAGVNKSDLSHHASSVVAANFDIAGTASVDFDKDTNRLSVGLTKKYKPAFLALLHPDEVPISVLAEVAFSEEHKVANCVMSLAGSGKSVLSLNGNSAIDASECLVHVNSKSSDAIDLDGSTASISSAGNCFVGNVASGLSQIQPPPDSNCQAMDDPFDDYEIPSEDNRTIFTNMVVESNSTATLDPGIYDGGLLIGTNADVTFNPGLYIIKNGKLSANGSADLSGEHVTFLFTGTDVAVEFSGTTAFNFTAMNEDVAKTNNASQLAGFLIYFDPSADHSLTSTLSGNANVYFEGILYFGDHDLVVSGNGSVNTDSPFSVVVANTIAFNGNAKLHFSADEDNTDLPVPPEIFEKVVIPYLVR